MKQPINKSSNSFLFIVFVTTAFTRVKKKYQAGICALSSNQINALGYLTSILYMGNHGEMNL